MAVDAEPVETAQTGAGSFVDAEPVGGSEPAEAPKKKSKAEEFEEAPMLERAIKAPTGAYESYLRGGANLVTGTLGQGFGSIAGLVSGENLEEALQTGNKVAETLHLNPRQEASAYFDEQIAKGAEFARNWIGENATKNKPLDKQTLDTLKDEAANRGIAEGVFDNVILPALLDRLLPKGGKVAEVPQGEPPIAKGPTGVQAELFSDERVQPETMMDQKVQSPYNLEQSIQEQLERELNPEAEIRTPDQGELFTGYNPAEKYTMSEEAGGRNRDVAGREEILEGEKVPEEMQPPQIRPENTEMKPNEFDEPRWSANYTPLAERFNTKGPMGRQRGVMDIDLLTLGVRHLLNTEGFRKVMERFRGTFSDVAVDHALRQSTDPKSRHTVVFMSPDKFLELARDREETKRTFWEKYGDMTKGSKELHDAADRNSAERRRESIREGINKKGLNQIPTLMMDVEEHFTPGAGVHSVIGHEGRHRADVFKEKGLELMPVLVTHQSLRWGERPIHDFPRKAISENGKFTEFPAPEFWGKDNLPELDFTKPDKFTNKGKFGQAGFINFGKGPAKAILDSKKQFAPDERKLEELGLNAQIKDIPASFKAATNALIDKSVSILSEKYGQVGSLLKWTIDNIKAIDRNSGLQLERDLYGEKYKPGKGKVYQPFEKRERGPEGALTNWKAMRSTRAGRAELREMVDKALANIGRDMSPDEFRTPRQYEAYRALQQALTNKLDEVNKERAQSGLKPIDRLPGYMPAFWSGDYRVHIYDGLGNHTKSVGFKTKFGADYAVKKLREAHPDLDIRDAEHVKIDRTQIGDLSAFEEAIRAMGKNDPASLALQKTLVELRGTKGFGRHGLQRKGVQGFLGMESGDLGVRNMEQSIEQYFSQANRYISNMKKARILANVEKLPLEVQNAAPRAMDYIHDYIANARGANIDQLKFVTNAVEGLSEVAGTGRSGPRALTNKISSVASLYMLSTGRFVLSQIPQHLNAFSKFIQLNVEGNFRNPVAAVYKGWEQFIMPDEVAKRAANWAQRNGYLESSLVQMLEMKLGDVTFERSRLLKDAVNIGLGKLEKAVVRMPSLFAFEYGLRDAVKDEGQRFKMAAEMMDYYMVNYNQTGRPIMYSKMGLVGDALKTFKQYSHNGWAQFFEYVRYASQQGGDIRPLVSHMAMQTAISGLKGTILIAEASAAVNLLNMMLPADDQIPTPQDLLMNSKLHDTLVYGGLSTMLGADISSSVNAPNIPQMFSAPAVSFSVNIAKSVGPYIMNKLTGTETEEMEMKAALAVAPAAMRGWIEELYTKPGQPVRNPNADKGDYIRKGNDDWWKDEHFLSKWFSVRSIDEARSRATISAVKKELAQDMNARISILDAIVDHIQEGKTDNVAQLVSRYVKNGGDPGKISQAIQKRMQERQMDYSSRQLYNKQITPNQAHKLEVMKNLLDRRSQPKSNIEAEEVPPVQKQGSAGVGEPNTTDVPPGERGGEISTGAVSGEIERRNSIIDRQMRREKERRYSPVEEQMTDEERDKYSLEKARKYREMLKRRKVTM